MVNLESDFLNLDLQLLPAIVFCGKAATETNAGMRVYLRPSHGKTPLTNCRKIVKHQFLFHKAKICIKSNFSGSFADFLETDCFMFYKMGGFWCGVRLFHVLRDLRHFNCFMFYMHNKSQIGDLGEDLACEYLKNKGYKILDRNFRRPWGELDIIAKAPDRTLVFVEVKTMGESDVFFPEENLTAAKLRKFKRVAALFAGSKAGQGLIDDKKGWRLDLIAVTLNDLTNSQENYDIRHYENIS